MRHAEGRHARRKMSKSWSRRLRLSRGWLWYERTVGVDQKKRALVLAATGFAIISMTFASFVVTNPEMASAKVIPSLWVNPETMTVRPYYTKPTDLYPVGYIVSDESHSTVCVLDEEGKAYTCQQVDLRR